MTPFLHNKHTPFHFYLSKKIKPCIVISFQAVMSSFYPEGSCLEFSTRIAKLLLYC